MDLTPKLKAEIDAMPHDQLMDQWETAPLDYQIFRGESGKYWWKRIRQLEKEAAAIAAMAFSCSPPLASRPTPKSTPDAILAALAGPSVAPVAPAADELDVVDELLLVYGMLR